jgi:hypothetical protein
MEEKNDTENANNLVSAAAVFATNSRSAFVDHYPGLKHMDVKDWEFLMTVAGTGTALLTMAESFPADRQRELTENVIRNLQAWNESGFAELRDFLDTVTGSTHSRVQMPDAIGSWVLRSVREVKSDPLAEHVIGLMLLKTFAKWWQ